MTFDPNSIKHIPSDWLSTTVTYRGWGRAEFLNPKSVVEGPAIVRFDQFGKDQVEMEVQRTDRGEAGTFSFFVPDFRFGPVPLEKDFNPCDRLTVKTHDGIFSATEGVRFKTERKRGGRRYVQLSLLRSRFEVTNDHTANYWVLPLSNFLSPMHQWHPELDQHPLRIFPTPSLPQGISQEDELAARFGVNLKNRLIVFHANGGFGFIERLPEFERRRRQLEKGRAANLITAVMVALTNAQNLDFANYQELFPLDVLNLLSLASGNRVGSPWIEFRDEGGQLIRRVHINFGHASYRVGHAAIFEDAYVLTGHLLTRGLASQETGQRYIRVVMTHLINAAIRRGTLEDRLLSLCRGFETLCKYHGLDRQDLLANIGSTERNQVQARLQALAQTINQAVPGQTDAAKGASLERIANRVRGAAQQEKMFGLAVVDLLEKYQLPDANIAQAHYQTNPDPQKQNWAGRLSYFRGAAIHEGSIDTVTQPNDLYEVVKIMDHMHDLLLRIVLTIVGYDGTYHSPIPPIHRMLPLDCVQTGTTADQLGYR